MSRRPSRASANRRQSSASALSSSSNSYSLPPILQNQLSGGVQTEQQRQQQQQQDRTNEISVIDSLVGTGPGNAASASSGRVFDADNFGIAAISGVTKRTGARSQTGGGGVLVDFMSYSEAPAYLDLPIPLHVHAPSSSAPSSSSSSTGKDRRESIVGFNNNSKTAKGSSSDPLEQSMNRGRTEREKKVTSAFLEPLHKFNTNEQLRYLDQTIQTGLAETEYAKQQEQKEQQRKAGGGGRHNKRGGGGKNKKYHHEDPPPQSQKIVLPKSIADMVHSLRPTHYAPLRKAMRTRSEERMYEGEDEEHERSGEGGGDNEQNKAHAEELKRLNEEKKRMQIEKNVHSWQRQEQQEQEKQRQQQQLLNVQPGEFSMSVSAPFTSDSNLLPQREVSPSVREPSTGSGGGGGHHHQQQQQHGTTPPLNTVHAGRRSNYNSAPLVGDLGMPSRTLPTHSHVNLLPYEMEESGGGGENNNTNNEGNRISPPNEASHVSESTTLLASASPSRSGFFQTAGGRSRGASISVASQEQNENKQKKEEFHRDLLAWYRTEATMLRIAL